MGNTMFLAKDQTHLIILVDRLKSEVYVKITMCFEIRQTKNMEGQHAQIREKKVKAIFSEGQVARQ